MQDMKYRFNKILFCIGLLSFLFGQQIAGQVSPLTLAQILTGLQAKNETLNTPAKKNQKIAADIEERGVAFQLIPEFETVLRNAGANNVLINAIRRKNAETSDGEISTGNAEFYFNRAETNRKSGNYDLAINDYDKALELKPNYPFAYYYRGFSYVQKGDHDRAFSDFSSAIKADSNFATAYLERGKIYNRRGSYDLAIDDYTKSIELDPKSSSAFYERGLTYIKKENYNQSIKDSTKAIQLEPDFAYAYINRGFAYKKNGTYYLAIADYSKAIDIDPDYEIAYNNRGVAYEERGYAGDYERAIADYRKALQLKPNYTYAKENLDKLLEKTGNYNTDVPTIKTVPKTISGGVINGRATYLPPPIYPASAQAVGAKGSVSVAVLIDEEGNVVSASATSGHPLLKGAAESAAKLAKFTPTRLQGQPVKVSGIVTYVFN